MKVILTLGWLFGLLPTQTPTPDSPKFSLVSKLSYGMISVIFFITSSVLLGLDNYAAYYSGFVKIETTLSRKIITTCTFLEYYFSDFILRGLIVFCCFKIIRLVSICRDLKIFLNGRSTRNRGFICEYLAIPFIVMTRIGSWYTDSILNLTIRGNFEKGLFNIEGYGWIIRRAVATQNLLRVFPQVISLILIFSFGYGLIEILETFYKEFGAHFLKNHIGTVQLEGTSTIVSRGAKSVMISIEPKTDIQLFNENFNKLRQGVSVLIDMVGILCLFLIPHASFWFVSSSLNIIFTTGISTNFVNTVDVIGSFLQILTLARLGEHMHRDVRNISKIKVLK